MRRVIHGKILSGPGELKASLDLPMMVRSRPIFKAQLPVQPSQDCLHLVDFLLLAFDDFGAKLFELSIGYRRLAAHQECTGVMRNH
jgi:hypothetical protein